MHALIRSSIVVIAVMAIAAGCATGGSGSTPAPTTAGDPSTPPSGDLGLALAASDLGQILVDDAGITLYGFTPDEGGTPTCYEGCAAAWPPVLADDAAAVQAGAGLDASLLTTADRTDGGKQLLYNGWPLYYFASDSAAGDTKGQGVGGNWFVIDATGNLIEQ